MSYMDNNGMRNYGRRSVHTAAAKCNRMNKEALLRLLVLETAGVILLFLWWHCQLRYQTVSDIRTVESVSEMRLTPGEDCRIDAIGFCRDEAEKSVFDEYPEYRLSGMACILDKAGTTIWEKEIRDLTIPYYRLNEQSGLLQTPLLLKQGETYFFVLEDEDGKNIDGITWTLYGGERDFLWQYLVIACFILTGIGCLYAMYYGWIGVSFPVLWIASLLLIALVSMLAMAPPCVPDEELHFGSAYAISDRILQLIPAQKASVGMAPAGALRMVGFGDKSYLHHFWNDWHYGNVLLPGAAGYRLEGMMPHYSYVVPAAGITLMRLLHAPYQCYIIAARLMDVLLYALLTLAAIRIKPEMKAAVAAISFLPSTLWIVNSCSYDVWNLGFCILFVCYCKKLADKERVSVWDLVGGLILLLLFVPIKFIYFNFVLFLLWISERQLAVRNKKRFWGSIIGVVFLGIAAVFIARGREVLAFLNGGGFDLRSEATLETKYTIVWVIQHPLKTLLVYIKSMYVSGGEIVRTLLLGDNYLNSVPVWLSVAIFTAFGVIMMGCAKERRREHAGRERLVPAAVLLSGIMLVMTSFLFVYSVRSDSGIGVINGMQGRYFLPFLICVPLVLSRREWAAERVRGSLYLLTAFSLLSILTRFGGVIL